MQLADIVGETRATASMGDGAMVLAVPPNTEKQV